MPALASPRPAAVEPVQPLIRRSAARDAHRRAQDAPVEMTMYFSPDGTLHHARCRRPLQFRRVRAEIEADFWCLACLEHVALSRYAVSQVPRERESDRPNVVRLSR